MPGVSMTDGEGTAPESGNGFGGSACEEQLIRELQTIIEVFPEVCRPWGFEAQIKSAYQALQ